MRIILWCGCCFNNVGCVIRNPYVLFELRAFFVWNGTNNACSKSINVLYYLSAYAKNEEMSIFKEKKIDGSI